MGKVFEWHCNQCGRNRHGDVTAQRNHRRSCGKSAPKGIEHTPPTVMSVALMSAAKEEVEKCKANVAESVFTERLSQSVSSADGQCSYRFTDDHILRLAGALSGTIDSYNVAAITKAIYSLYTRPVISSHLAAGKSAESKMESLRHHDCRFTGRQRQWKVVYRDIEGSEPLKISRIRLNGKPILGKPDLVLKNRSGVCLLIERKLVCGNYAIPADGFPNLRAQLFAYRHADFFSGKSVVCVGELWKGDQLRSEDGRPLVISYAPKALEPQRKIFEAMGLEVVPSCE